ncbi:MAG: P1 family peptidase, partial [Pseudomonadota bacterium]
PPRDQPAPNTPAQLAMHGRARRDTPLTRADGDTMFALPTGRAAAPGTAGTLSLLGAAAAEAVVRAIRNAVRAAGPWPFPR